MRLSMRFYQAIPGRQVTLRWLALVALSVCPAISQAADVVVTEAWVRATVPAQKSTGAFLNIVSPEDAALVSASTPVAGLTELHTMSMSLGIMRMRRIDKVPLPANETVSLQPGGNHIMLMQLNKPLTTGEFVPMTLRIESGGKVQEIELEVPVKPITTR